MAIRDTPEWFSKNFKRLGWRTRSGIANAIDETVSRTAECRSEEQRRIKERPFLWKVIIVMAVLGAIILLWVLSSFKTQEYIASHHQGPEAAGAIEHQINAFGYIVSQFFVLLGDMLLLSRLWRNIDEHKTKIELFFSVYSLIAVTVVALTLSRVLYSVFCGYAEDILGGVFAMLTVALSYLVVIPCLIFLECDEYNKGTPWRALMALMVGGPLTLWSALQTVSSVTQGHF